MYLSIYNTSLLSKKIDDDQFKLSVKTWAGGGGQQQKIIQRSWSINYFESHNQYFSK